jgi:transketolase
MRNTCLNEIYNLAKKNKKIIFVGSDLGAGVLKDFREKIPNRFFMEGISEQNVIGISAGLASQGFLPFVNTIATFLTRRCFEQICIDLCLHKFPVKLIGNGGGLVYAPLGPTHLAIDDIALMRSLPQMTICAVSDSVEMKKLIKSSQNWKLPMYIRLARGGDDIISHGKDFKIGKNIIYKKSIDRMIFSTGIMTQVALKVSEVLFNKFNLKYGVTHCHTIQPLDKNTIIKRKSLKKIVTLEEHFKDGGLGSAICDMLIEKNLLKKIDFLKLGLEKKFIHNYGSQKELLKKNNLDLSSIIKKIMKFENK